MMKKIACFAACILAVMAFSACSSFEIGTDTNGLKLTENEALESIGHVNGEIWGIYVFGLPLISGSATESGKCTVFNETVDTSSAISFMTRQTRMKLNAKYLTDVTSERTSVWLFPTLFFFYREIQVSGNVLK